MTTIVHHRSDGRHDDERVLRRTRAVADLVARATGIHLPLRLWDGSLVDDPGPGDDDPGFCLVLRHPWSLRAMLVPPTDRNVGEAYLRDDIDVTGDLVAALHAVARIAARLSATDRARLATRLLALPRPPADTSLVERAAAVSGRRHTRARDRDAVRFHYDLGNAFFRCFLDEDLVYSCAYFADADTSLEEAQRRKLDLVARKLELGPGDTVLDVGCGWGSFVLHAARTYGCSAVGVTLAREQAALARERVARAGLDDRVEIRLADYREVDDTFDAIASIGMVEHVGTRNLRAYAHHLRGLLRPGGRLLNHGITTGARRRVRDIGARDESFVGRYVFPDGGLAPASRMVTVLEDAGFEIHDVHQLRPNYALTLRAWIQRLEANHDRAVAAASEVDYRIWRAYMAGSVVGFETNQLGVVQVLGGRDATPPLDRGVMQPRWPSALHA